MISTCTQTGSSSDLLETSFKGEESAFETALAIWEHEKAVHRGTARDLRESHQNGRWHIIDLGRRSLSSLPSVFLRLEHLKSVILRGNHFSAIPLEVASLPNIINLDLADNEIAELSWPSDSSPLTCLDVSNNGMTHIAHTISRLPYLQVLILENNQLEDFPETMKDLQDLRTLYLGRNSFSTLPQPITTLPVLGYLDLSNNRLTKLDPGILKLVGLRTLNLRHNGLMQIPDSLCSMPNLISLLLDDNKLRKSSIYSNAKEIVRRCLHGDKPTNVRVVSLRNNDIRHLSMENLSELVPKDKGSRDYRVPCRVYSLQNSPPPELKLLLAGNHTPTNPSRASRAEAPTPLSPSCPS